MTWGRETVVTPEIDELLAALDRNEREARALVDGLTEEQGTARLTPGSWSVAECLDHLATANRVYVASMQEPAVLARQRGTLRRQPALPGMFGDWFVKSMEPSSKTRLKAPKKIRPRQSPPLASAFADFLRDHAAAVAFIRENADLDLASIRFKNPFVGWIRFSLATGVHIIAAHERRHLVQAAKVRAALHELHS
jgi:hypothetical protein